MTSMSRLWKARAPLHTSTQEQVMSLIIKLLDKRIHIYEHLENHGMQQWIITGSS